jgi:hypothetical protein
MIKLRNQQKTQVSKVQKIMSDLNEELELKTDMMKKFEIVIDNNEVENEALK